MKTKGLSVHIIYSLLSVIVLLVLCAFTDAAQHTISGVPDYQNSWFTGRNDCAPTASACVLGYWDSHGYDNLIDGSPDYGANPDGVTELVDFLKTDLGWTSVEGTLISNMPGGIEATANDRRGYSFSASNDSSVSWSDITTEIEVDRPFVFSIVHPYYGGGGTITHHAVTGVGYTEDAGGGGGTYYLNSIADSYVDSTKPEENYGSLSSFFAGRYHDGGYLNALIKFDLSSIDPGTKIDSAVLRLNCNIISGDDDLFVFLVANSWSENGVTWNNKPGIDISAYTFHSPQGSGQTWEIDVTEHVQQWVNETKTNHGFYLAGRYTPVNEWVNFSSRESVNEASRPELVINAGWSDEIVIVHDNWTQYFPYDPDVWLNFNECDGAYLTQVLPGGGTSGDSYEPDDTHGQANEILSGSPQNHSIVPATDEDWVWFSLSEESEVIIETSGPSGDTRMWLYDNSLIEIEYDDDGGTDYFSRIDRVCGVDPLAVGTYYVKIDEYENDDEISSYDITLTVTTCTGAPGQLQFSSANYTVRENGGTATITVDRVVGSDGTVTVSYEAIDGTAREDHDYKTANGTINFSDGEISEMFTVTIIDDDLIEEDEFINLSLRNPTGGATLGSQDTAVLSITDNEPDLNGDGIVNFFDYAVFDNHWLDTCAEPKWCEGADFDSSSKVDFNDLVILCNLWLELQRDIIYSLDLDSNPGWTMEGEWDLGQPTGDGGSHGSPDPDSGYSGCNVYGVNLNGDYTITVGGPYYLSAGPLDCNEYHNVQLKFARWLNTDTPTYVASKTEASNNGIDWSVVWEHTGSSDITDNSWQTIEHDISNVADDQETVYLRWSYQILNAQAYSYSGWNIDDIQLLGSR